MAAGTQCASRLRALRTANAKTVHSLTTAHPDRAGAQRGPPPARVVVLSDLHMGAGAGSGRGDPLECFFHDRALVALLDRLAGSWARRGLQGSLVLNGDSVDFVRIVRLPGGPEEVRAWGRLLSAARVAAPAGALDAAAAGRFGALEQRYGFDASEYESVWKLWVAAQGHAAVFAALARWCRAGHELVVVRGNHDSEWAWPGVRRAFRVLLQDSGAGPLGGRVRFRMGAYRNRNLHVEHGHAVRWTTSVDGRLTGGVRPRLKQPFGSLLNRYLLNPVERLAQRPPDVPSALHLKRLLQQEPGRLGRRLLRNALRDLPAFGRAGWRSWHRRAHRLWPTRVADALGLALLSLPFLSPHVLAALSLDSPSALTGTALLALATPHLGLAVLELVNTVRDDTVQRARALARRLAARLLPPGTPGDRIVILGHTHLPELLSHPAASGRIIYANPGCWQGEDDRLAGGRPCFVWCAWDGVAYRRTRLLELPVAPRGCRTRARS